MAEYLLSNCEAWYLKTLKPSGRGRAREGERKRERERRNKLEMGFKTKK
jgi:hypothetical protein